jgi:hypothetical protein
MLVAVLTIIVLSAIPHHHHKDVVCMVMEVCEQDHTFNDKHTGHSSDASSNHQSSCITGSEYASVEVISTKGKAVSSDTGSSHHPEFPVLYLLIDSQQYRGISHNTKHSYPEFIIPFVSTHLGHSSGFRAPPFYIA